MTTPLRKLIEQVYAWNAANPIGTPVHVRMDTQCLDTVTRSEASVLGGHTAVIWLEGVSGAYALSRVAARRPGAKQGGYETGMRETDVA